MLALLCLLPLFIVLYFTKSLKNFRDSINWNSNIDSSMILLFSELMFLSFNLVFPESFEKIKLSTGEVQKPLKAFQILNIHSLVREAA